MILVAGEAQVAAEEQDVFVFGQLLTIARQMRACVDIIKKPTYASVASRDVPVADALPTACFGIEKCHLF